MLHKFTTMYYAVLQILFLLCYFFINLVRYVNNNLLIT